ncbi:MAG: hypothetical protein H0U64_02240 [Gemmatimonadaceae bacterium]|nr:hypothetical protein [Gemmatimonadaceae bacterium]
MIRTIYDPPLVQAMCVGCRQSACRCHDAAFMAEFRKPRYVNKADRDRQERRALETAIETAPPEEPVLLARAPIPFEGGLIINGVASTRGWDRYDTLLSWQQWSDGDTFSRHRGRVMRKMRRTLPIPLLVSHDATKRVGVMFEARATMDKLYFTAAVAPPGTPDYDDALLVRTWGDIRAQKMGCVSFAALGVNKDGTWRPLELSICEKGANPLAVITRAQFTDGLTLYADEPPFNEAVVRKANDQHRAAHEAKLRAAEEEKRRAAEQTRGARGRDDDGDDPPVRWRGVWRAGTEYTLADSATHDGALWYCHKATSEKPGTSHDWQLMSKSPRGPK